MVDTVASLLVLINTQGLASWTGLPGLTMRRIFRLALMEVIVQGATGETGPGSRAMLHRAGTADIDRGIIFLLTSASLLHEPVRLDGLAD